MWVRATAGLFASIPLATPALGAIAFDDSTSVNGRDVSSIAWSHTVGAGTGRILIVGVSFRDPSSQTLDSLTYGGTDLTFIGGVTDTTAGEWRVETYKLLTPPVGADSVRLTFSGNVRVAAGSASFTGVSATTPHGAFTSAKGNDSTPTVSVSSAAGELVMDVLAVKGDATSATEGAGQTKLWYQETPGGGNDANGAASTESGAASVTMSWTLDTSTDWAIGAISLKPGFDLQGKVFEDPNFAGTATDYDGGVSDTVCANVDVELYDADNSDAYLASTVTDASGNYLFTVTNGNYKVRARSVTIGDADTAPKDGTNACVPVTCARPLPEMTWGNGSALVGGQSATVDDTATANDAGPGDTYVTVNVSGANVSTVNLGMAYHVIFNTLDDANGTTVQSTQGSLRSFLKNSQAIAGVQSSEFRIPGAGPHTIQPVTSLPTLSDSLVLDGYTQPGAQANTVAAPAASDAVLKIEIDGSISGTMALLDITAGSSTVKGLVINRSPGFGIRLQTNGGNTIEGNYIGTNVAGTAGLGNINDGIRVESNTNTIGGLTPAARNLISANGNSGPGGDDGIRIQGSTGNQVLGNFLGTTVTGLAALGNYDEAISLMSGASSNVIGGSSAAARNLIADSGVGGVLSGTHDGIYLDAAGVSSNTIQGNSIGTDVNGTGNLGNSHNGIRLFNGPSNNTIGGPGSGEGNRIAYNTFDGVELAGATTDGNVLSGNSIFGNGTLGIDLDGAGANDDKIPPVLVSATPVGPDITLVATTASGDTVEFFRANNAASPVVTPDGGGGEGYEFLGRCVDNGACSGPHMSSASDDDPAAGTVQADVALSELSFRDYLTSTASALSGTSEFSANLQVDPLAVTKKAFLSDGTPVSTGETLPKGTRVKYLLYVNNPGGAQADVSIRDPLDPFFQFIPGSIKFANTFASCASLDCTGAEEDSILAHAEAGTVGSDLVDGDVVSFVATTVDAGDASQANARLDILGGKVWAMVFTVRVD